MCVLEDLKRKGYRMTSSARSAEGIDFNHAKVALVTYANYHALSVANQRRFVKSDGSRDFPSSYEIFRKDPNYINPAIVYRTIVLPQYIKVLRHFQQGEVSSLQFINYFILSHLISAVSTQVADWLDGLLPDLEKIWNWESFVDSGPLTCLLHGDSWNNNILFRYPSEASNEPEEMALIDWQIARLGHPSHDLGYFLFSSTSSNFRKQHLDELFTEYFTALSIALGKLGIDLSKEGYSQAKFLEEVKQRYILMMMIALFILPILLDNSKAKDHTLKNENAISKNSDKPVQQEGMRTMENINFICFPCHSYANSTF